MQNAGTGPAFQGYLQRYYASGTTTTFSLANTSLCTWNSTSCSPVVRRTPFGKRTSLFATSTPAAVTASAISRVPIEPNSLPSSPDLDEMVTEPSSLILVARASAAPRTSPVWLPVLHDVLRRTQRFSW